MKATKRQLKQIIKEELQNLMEQYQSRLQGNLPAQAITSDTPADTPLYDPDFDYADTGLGAISTGASFIPHPAAQALSYGAGAAQHGLRVARGTETPGEALMGYAAEALPAGKIGRAMGTTADVARRGETVMTTARQASGVGAAADNLFARSSERQQQRAEAEGARRARPRQQGERARGEGGIRVSHMEPEQRQQHYAQQETERQQQQVAQSPSDYGTGERLMREPTTPAGTPPSSLAREETPTPSAKRDDLAFPYLYTEHIQRIIQEEIQQILQEQGGAPQEPRGSEAWQAERGGIEQYIPQGYQASDLYTDRHLAGQEGYESSVRWADPEIQTSLGQRFGAGEEGRLAAREAGFAQGQHGQYMPFQGASSVMAGTHGSDPSQLGVSPAVSRARAAQPQVTPAGTDVVKGPATTQPPEPTVDPKRAAIEKIVQEELHAILSEQIMSQIPQDIPTGGAPPPPDPDPAPVFTRTGRELTPEYLQSLGMPGEPGYESPEEYFEQNPENRPVEVAEPETDPVYGIERERSATTPGMRYIRPGADTYGVPIQGSFQPHRGGS